MPDPGFPYLGSFFFEVTAVLLSVLLIASSWTDITTRRVPNWLVLIGLIAGLVIQFLFSFGSVFMWGSGLLVGLTLLLPPYIFRVMGAGDVKLMGMVGSFLGPAAILDVALLSLISGGILAVTVGLWNGALQRTIANTGSMLTDNIIKVSHRGNLDGRSLKVSAGDLPYAVAIAAGTFIQLVFMCAGCTFFG